MLGPDIFCLLNETHALAETGWNGRAQEKLWLYNLHYFDDLNALDAHARKSWHVSLLERWVKENPPGVGNGWEPYPTSLRIVNWVKWVLAGNRLPGACLDSLAVQARWLSKRFERHLRGNHLFANAKALLYAGLFFQGKEAEAWRKKAITVIARELPEQVLPDGGNFERSTMYHSIFMEDVLDLINLASAYCNSIDDNLLSRLGTTSVRMLDWMDGMLHPDGQISLFNDAAFYIAPEPAELHSYARRLGIKQTELKSQSLPQLKSFPDSGYVRMSSADAMALLDLAPVGPDYLPGHAHADTLSFELSLFQQRVVVNGGTSCYGQNARRLRERQTLSHSTVEVAGQSSSEVWGAFRVARRARPFDILISEGRDVLSVSCAHDGYKYLAGKPVHRREWVMSSGWLSVMDNVAVDRHSGVQYAAVARYILHPDVRAAKGDDGEWILTLQEGIHVKVKVLHGRAELQPANYAPEFGTVLPTECLAITLIEGLAQTQWTWN